ncbi:hypothetical protein Hanom_Chr13g01230791 [Helianthus anomalus]
MYMYMYMCICMCVCICMEMKLGMVEHVAEVWVARECQVRCETSTHVWEEDLGLRYSWLVPTNMKTIF